MKYRDMAPDELVEEGDEIQVDGVWVKSERWKNCDMKQVVGFAYRRPIKDAIQDRLQALSVEMQDVALLMLADDQSELMRAEGHVLQSMQWRVSEWLESMKAEGTIQGFVEERKR